MTMNFEELVLHHKGDKSYSQICEAAGGTVSVRTMQSVTRGGFSRLPDTGTLLSIASALDIHPRDLFLAAARTLGIPVDIVTNDDEKGVAIDDTHRPGTPDAQEQIYYWRKHAEHYKARAHAKEKQ